MSVPSAGDARALDVAVVHDLPPGGGAFRVLAEYVAARPRHRFTVYTPRPAPAQDALVNLPADVILRPMASARRAVPLDRYLRLWSTRRRGRALAGVVDRGGHDVAFVFPTEVTGGSEALPHLRTPALTYVPEALRIAHEAEPEFGRVTGWKGALTRHGLNPFERKRAALDRMHVRAARRVVTHSQFTAHALRRVYGVEAEVVLLGVDAAAFAAPPQPRSRSVLSVGALHPLKGHQFVIDALATLPAAQRPPLVVVGDRGTMDGPLLELAARRGVQLQLRQAIPFAELVRCYASAGALAAGQLREPFGLATLEAMAAGLPVVAVDEGGFRETVVDGHTGLLVPRDATAFGVALARVLDDAALQERLRAAALHDVRERWTWERTAAGYDALLAALASGSDGRAGEGVPA
jgi:glycosyltransferase involved in cell wall biosynthesis